MKKLTMIAALGLSVACTPHNDDDNREGLNSNNESLKPSPSNQKTVLEVSRPDPATMQAEVAELVTQAWDEKQSRLAAANITDQEKAQIWANYGLIAFGNGLSLPAEQAFENAALLDAEEPKWGYFLALLHQYSGDLDKAATRFEHVLQSQPDNISALLRFASVRFEQAQSLPAQSLYQAALDLNPDSAAALYGLGRIAIQNGEHQQAIDLFERALELQPGADRIHYFLGLAWRNLGNADKAQASLSRFGANEPTFADPLFDQISGGKQRIDGLWAHMNAGSRAFVEGDYSLAVKEFRLATKDLPNDSRSWQSLGMALNKTQDLKQARQAYQKALELAPNDAVIHHELAKIEIATGASKSAEKRLTRALELDPRMLDGYRTLAAFLQQQGHHTRALKQYDQALQIDPQATDLKIQRAQSLLALNRASEAKLTLEAAVNENPNHAEARMALGLVLANLDQPVNAASQVKQALEMADDDDTLSRAHYAMGQVFLKQSRIEDAIASLGSALKLNPRHQAAGLELARSFIRLRNYQQALATYDVHINYWPTLDTNRIEAANVALMLGDGDKAKQLLEGGLSHGSNSARLKGSLARLLVLSTDPSVNDTRQALKLAEQALASSRQPQHRETLALCLAASGNYAAAIEQQQALLQDAGPQFGQRTRTRMQRNLQRYQANTLGRLPLDAKAL